MKLTKKQDETLKQLDKKGVTLLGKNAVKFYNAMCGKCKRRWQKKMQRNQQMQFSEYCEECQEKWNNMF